MECAGNRPNHGGDSISIIADINAGDTASTAEFSGQHARTGQRRHTALTHVQSGANISKFHHRRFPNGDDAPPISTASSMRRGQRKRPATIIAPFCASR